MADDELEYDDFYFEDGDNYFYIDDGYALADELAESSVPEPGINDYAEDWDDLTRFEYFNDLEYDSDGFNDRKPRTQTTKERAPAFADSSRNKKRKRGGAAGTTASSKRRKVPTRSSTQHTSVPLIVLQPKPSIKDESIADVSKLKSYSILPDWREQFKDIKGITSVFSDANSQLLQTSIEEESAAEEEDDVEGEGESTVATSEAVKALGMSLEHKLSDMGLDVTKIDQSKLLLLAQKMMSGDEDTEDLLAEIIQSIHGGEDEDEDAEDARDPFSQWVAGNIGTSAGEIKEANENEVDATRVPERDSLSIEHAPIAGNNVWESRRSNGTTFARKRKKDSPEMTPTKRKQPMRKG